MNTNERIDRPDALDTVVQRIDTGYGKLYVRIGIDDDGDPVEVFLTKGQSGGLLNAMLEALSKSLSNALRSGTDPEVLADDLVGIRMDKVENDNGDTIQSIPDAVGIAMFRYTRGKIGESVRDEVTEE